MYISGKLNKLPKTTIKTSQSNYLIYKETGYYQRLKIYLFYEHLVCCKDNNSLMKSPNPAVIITSLKIQLVYQPKLFQMI